MDNLIGQIALGVNCVENRRIGRSLSSIAGWSNAHVASNDRNAFLAKAGRAAGKGRSGTIGMFQGFLTYPEHLSVALSSGSDRGSDYLIALAAERWGQNAAQHVCGEYVASVYDPSLRTGFLLRDHIGTRPIYWHWEDGILSFATGLADLLAILSDKPEPDEETIAAFLQHPVTLGSRTFFSGIKIVEPGHMLTFQPGGVAVRQWWNIEDVPDTRFKNLDDYANAARELVERAVSTRLPKGRAIGAHLSGGLDSTAVTLIAQEKLRKSGGGLLGAYSWSPPISPDAPEFAGLDDRKKVLAISGAAGLHPRFAALDGIAFRSFLSRPLELEGVADVADEFSTLEQARADGIAVMLSGWGGDEAFSAHAHGVPAYLMRRGRLADVWRLMRAHGGLRRPHRMAYFFWRTVAVPLLPDRLFQKFGPFDNIYGRNRYASARLQSKHPAQNALSSGRFTADPIRDIKNAVLRGHIAERMVTWASWGQSFGVEYRYPLTDRSLLEFVFGIPPEILWGDRRSRFLARHILRGRVSGRLGKSDHANEKKRLLELRQCWSILSHEVADGRFDSDCPWLDMPVLRNDLARGPSGNDKLDVTEFARIMPAVRIWHMADRQGQLQSKNLR